MTNGTLALVGSGEYLPAMQPVDRALLNRIDGEPRVVCLPTAAGTEGAERINYWSNLGVEHFTRLGAQVKAVEVIDRASAEDDSLAARIRQANFVYLSGGKPTYLYETLNGSRAWAAILDVLDGGGVLAGCSAGAMILGERSTPFGGSPGFGLLPGTVILPHFDEIAGEMVSVLRTLFLRKFTMVGVEGNTALVYSDDTFSVLGSGGVTIWNRDQKTRYRAKQTVDWRIES